MSATILREVRPLSSNPDFVRAVASVVGESAGKVCDVCGLEMMGHAPESEWLGFEPHSWAGRPATAAEVTRAGELTSAAYRARRVAREAQGVTL